MNELNFKHIFRFYKAYRGTHALDELSFLKLQNEEVITVNLDPRSLPGSHWLAIARKNNILYILDSLNLGYYLQEPYIKQFIKIQKCCCIVKNVFRMQSLSSSTCGLYVCLFTVCFLLQNNDFKFNKFCQYFEPYAFETNDKQVVSLLTKFLPSLKKIKFIP